MRTILPGFFMSSSTSAFISSIINKIIVGHNRMNKENNN